VSAPAGERLAAVAGWDADALGGAVGALMGVAERLSGSVFPFEAVARRLADATVWSGPSAAACADGALALSRAVVAVAAAADESLAACRRVAAEAATAAALARAALVPAAGEEGALAAEALHHADRAARAVDQAGRAMVCPAVSGSTRPAAVADPVTRAAVHALPQLPVAASPSAVAQWWAAMPPDAHRALIRRRPARIGSLDGVPAEARDRANRLLLGRALRRPVPSATARAVADVLATHEAAGRTVQLHLFDEPGERVAVGLGDVDTAQAVALLVPGVGTTPAGDLGRVTAAAARTVDSAVRAGGGAAAGIAWLGYRPPRWADILRRSRAEETGPVLDDVLDGLAASRAAAGAGAARTTVLAHSYGTVVVDEAADAPGILAADAVVLLGSPGMEGSAAGLEADEVYDAASASDPVVWSGWFGTRPWWEAYGAVGLPVAAGAGHSGYYDTGGPTLAAIGAVVASGWPG
jgi:hypothetical protein